jgi:hypothetical protein
VADVAATQGGVSVHFASSRKRREPRRMQQGGARHGNGNDGFTAEDAENAENCTCWSLLKKRCG